MVQHSGIVQRGRAVWQQSTHRLEQHMHVTLVLVLLRPALHLLLCINEGYAHT